MPRKKINELSAGIFVSIALIALLGTVLWLGAADVFKPTKQRALFYFNEGDTSGGLKQGSFVTIGGDTIGKITKSEFVPEDGRTYYLAEIERADVKIHSDGVAKLEAALVGGANLSVTRGSQDKPLADSHEHAIRIVGGAMDNIAQAAEMLKQQLDETRPDSLVSKIMDTVEKIRREVDPGIETTVMGKIHASLSSLKEMIASLRDETNKDEEGTLLAKLHRSAEKLKQITASIHRETDPEQPDSIVSRVRGIATDVKDITGDAKPKIRKATTNVEQVTDQINTYTRKDIAQILTTLRKSNTEILKIARNFTTISEQGKKLLLINRENIDEIIDNMTIVSANLKATSKEVRRHPWKLLHKPEPKEQREQNIYDAARAFLSGAEQLDQTLAKLSGLAKAHPEGIDPKDPKFQEIRKAVLKTFDKFKKAEDALWNEFK